MDKIEKLQCTYCGKRKPKNGFARIEGTGKFIRDRAIDVCPSCTDHVIDNIKSLPWEPTFQVTWPY